MGSEYNGLYGQPQSHQERCDNLERHHAAHRGSIPDYGYRTGQYVSPWDALVAESNRLNADHNARYYEEEKRRMLAARAEREAYEAANPPCDPEDDWSDPDRPMRSHAESRDNGRKWRLCTRDSNCPATCGNK